MSDQFVRLAGPPQGGWRIAHTVLAIGLLAFMSWLWIVGGPLWLIQVLAAVAVWEVANAALSDDTETWVRPEGLTIRRRNLFRTVIHTSPVSEVKAIWVRPDLLSPLHILQPAIIPLTWRVVISTARHGRITGGQSNTERDVWALEQRVRLTLGW